MGQQGEAFSLAIVNQQIDYERDEKLSVQFAESIGVNSKEVLLTLIIFFPMGM